MMANFDKIHYVFLREIIGCDDIRHRNKTLSTGTVVPRTLFDHLEGTALLLLQWNQPHHVIMAGMYHSIYGTSQFPHATFPRDGRHIIRRLIGQEAEEIAFEFCAADRRKWPWGELVPFDRRGELYTIEAANLIDQQDQPKYVARLLGRPELSGVVVAACSEYVAYATAKYATHAATKN
jgi:hypothetical protein